MAPESVEPDLPPLSREQLWGIIEIFLVELNHLCQNAEEGSLKALAPFASIVAEYAEDFRGPENNPAQLLRIAFAYLDEYCSADRESVIAAVHSACLIASHGPGGNSN